MGKGGGAAGVRGAGIGAEQRGLYHQAQGGHGIIHAQKQYEGKATEKAAGLQGTSEDQKHDESGKDCGDSQSCFKRMIKHRRKTGDAVQTIKCKGEKRGRFLLVIHL